MRARTACSPGPVPGSSPRDVNYAAPRLAPRKKQSADRGFLGASAHGERPITHQRARSLTGITCVSVPPGPRANLVAVTFLRGFRVGQSERKIGTKKHLIKQKGRSLEEIVADRALFDEGVTTFQTFTEGPYHWVRSYEPTQPSAR